jgi:hypothetical protein
MYNIARQLDLSTHGNGMDCDAVKLFCAPMAKRVADRAMQVNEYGTIGIMSTHVDNMDALHCHFLKTLH